MTGAGAFCFFKNHASTSVHRSRTTARRIFRRRLPASGMGLRHTIWRWMTLPNTTLLNIKSLIGTSHPIPSHPMPPQPPVLSQVIDFGH